MEITKNKKNKVFLIASLIIIFIFLAIFLTFGYFYNKYNLDIEELTSLNNGIRVYSASGIDTTLYNTHRSIIEIENLPEHVKQAFISVEDKRFYEHNGYDLKRIIKASLVNIANNSKSQGASTISQQLIKNALLTNEKTYSRKIKEIILSIKMEKIFTKDEILEMYLNTIYFGSNAYGIENASITYFNKSAKDLNINEACCLAGLIKSPSYYSPRKNIDNATNRKNLVASLMLKNGFIQENEYQNLISEPLVINCSTHNNNYEEEAIYEACRLLNITERELINNKYQIITFKNDELQKEISFINNDIISANENENCDLDSLTIVANNNAQVEAYYANSNFNLHNLTRQAASTLKPLAVYLPCIKYNIISPASPLLDEEINYNGFSPKNADNKFYGYISAKQALANSLNTTAVKLLDSLGLAKSKEMLSNLGINISNSDMNLSLALGSTKKGIKIMDLIQAYSTLANMGKFNQLCFVNKILDKNGNIVYKHENTNEQVVNASDCYLINDMLKQTAKTGTAKRLDSLNMPLACKTGTAGSKNGNTDLYNITYSTEHTILTWIADINKQFLPDSLYSSSQPTDINKKICSYLYNSKSPKDFQKPENIVYSPYSLIELENNRTLMAPSENELERYIAYDYFKLENLPSTNSTRNVNLSAELTKDGVVLKLKAEKNKTYKVFKVINDKTTLLKEISNENGDINFLDYSVFNYENIKYYIADEYNFQLTEMIELRPKDYLINMLNNQLLSTKKKWPV